MCDQITEPKKIEQSLTMLLIWHQAVKTFPEAASVLWCSKDKTNENQVEECIKEDIKSVGSLGIDWKGRFGSTWFYFPEYACDKRDILYVH